MIAIGCDHGGYLLKEEIKKYLDEKNIEYKDFGTYTEERTDYPIYAKKVCDLLKNSEIRASIDSRNETLGKRIRDIAQFRVPLLVVVGEKEEADGTVSVRREGVNVGTMSADDFVKYVKSAVAEELS